MEGGGPPRGQRGPGPGNADRRSTAPVANEEGLVALGKTIDATRPRSSQRRRRLRRTLVVLGLVVVLILVLGGSPFFAGHL